MTHPLDGPRLKVRRAICEIERLCREEEAFRRDAQYQLVRGEFDPKSGRYAYRLCVQRTPPLVEWGVWIGEIAHDLRSALDELVDQLVRANGKTPTPSTRFPICLHRHGRPLPGGRWRYHGFEGGEPGSGRAAVGLARPEHQAMIERLQPYHRRGWRQGGRCHPLFLLKEIDDAEKHRLLRVVGMISGFDPFAGSWGDPALPTVYPRWWILKDGVKILSAPPEVYVQAQFTPLIAFAAGCPAARGRGVCSVLSAIAEQVSETIEGFGPEFP
jgi:hypothetical protein